MLFNLKALLKEALLTRQTSLAVKHNNNTAGASAAARTTTTLGTGTSWTQASATCHAAVSHAGGVGRVKELGPE